VRSTDQIQYANLRRRNYSTGLPGCQHSHCAARILRRGGRWLAGVASLLVLLTSGELHSAGPPAEARLVHSTYTEHFFIHFSEGRHEDAKAAARVAEERWDAVRRELGLAPTRRVHLYLAGSHTELEALCAGPEDHRLAGRAQPKESVIVLRLRGPAQRRHAVLAHELVHVALGQALEPHGLDPPQWLTEGLSEYIADLVTPGDQRRGARGMPLAMKSLHVAFPREPHASDLAYAQSRSFVEFLVRETGDKALGGLVRALGETGDIEQAFLSAYGRSLSDFEAEWRPHFARGLGRALPIDPGTAIFMFMGVLFLVVCIVRIVRRRRRRMAEELEEMQGEEEYWQSEDDF
jgi:hypothetical protein